MFDQVENKIARFDNSDFSIGWVGGRSLVQDRVRWIYSFSHIQTIRFFAFGYAKCMLYSSSTLAAAVDDDDNDDDDDDGVKISEGGCPLIES